MTSHAVSGCVPSSQPVMPQRGTCSSIRKSSGSADHQQPCMRAVPWHVRNPVLVTVPVRHHFLCYKRTVTCVLRTERNAFPDIYPTIFTIPLFPFNPLQVGGTSRIIFLPLDDFSPPLLIFYGLIIKYTVHSSFSICLFTLSIHLSYGLTLQLLSFFPCYLFRSFSHSFSECVKPTVVYRSLHLYPQNTYLNTSPLLSVCSLFGSLTPAEVQVVPPPLFSSMSTILR